ncbi:D-amino acid dehydrogenase [Photobacterium sp. 1_MG-2023]|uniref:D-amino acid dehydrogenase n=1 Tax=Photobacterium sp. 1_MG-2023 TaxID=3062646 RepID=UPI0026E28F4A|nr:D-amino acid dehydrogenase [Photobacterium sp. 1_MG-2023]MDO6707292.1 D-amino acid dehydrogenase [Photobacterium sp. 1_MG-2023]
MEVIVLGSGVVGLTSAWYLAQQGHQVTVIDRQSRSAEETSFANAGQISYGYSSPWAAPGIPVKAMKWLVQKHAPLKIKPSLSPDLYSWMGKMLANCNHESYQRNKSRMLRVANYSRASLIELRQQHDLHYEGRQQGTLQLLRTQAQLDAVGKDIQVLKESGIQFELLDVNGCIQAEPALAKVREKIAGGLRLPNDETGDCYKFCQQLTALAEQAGVTFEFNTQVKSLRQDNQRIVAVETDRGEFKADAYVVAMGSYSTAMLATLGMQLPVYPVKGYSLTMPLKNSDGAPVSTVIDETYKVAMTRFDNRIRVAGTAELAGFNLHLSEQRKETIAMVVGDLFPEGGDLNQAEYWTGLRPMTPDGTPVIGKTPFENLYTNTGHGTLGWTMACGSGRLLADIVSGRDTDIDTDGLSIQRYLHSA